MCFYRICCNEVPAIYWLNYDLYALKYSYYFHLTWHCIKQIWNIKLNSAILDFFLHQSHTAGRGFSSDWSVKSFIIVFYENFFKFCPHNDWKIFSSVDNYYKTFYEPVRNECSSSKLMVSRSRTRTSQKCPVTANALWYIHHLAFSGVILEKTKLVSWRTFFKMYTNEIIASVNR